MDNSPLELEKRYRAWLAHHFSPTVAVFSSKDATKFLRDNACLSPAEFLRPFSVFPKLDRKQMYIIEKNLPYELRSFQLRLIDKFKMSPQYYKDPEYASLFSIIQDTEKPKVSF